MEAIVDSSIARIRCRQNASTDDHKTAKYPFSFPVDFQSDVSPSAALNLLQQLRSIMKYLVPEPQEHHNLYQSLIWHKDLHLGNIFISPAGSITSLIGWQETAAEPLFLSAEIPKFLGTESGVLRLELPKDFASTHEPEKSRIRIEYYQSMLQKYYLGCLGEEMPEIFHFLNNDPLIELRQHTAVLAGGSLDHQTDSLLYRELLIRIRRNWKNIISTGSDSTCPISITPDELKQHQADARRWNSFKDTLQQHEIPVASDGWVPKEDFKVQRDKLRFLLAEYGATLCNNEEQLQFHKNIQSWNITD